MPLEPMIGLCSRHPTLIAFLLRSLVTRLHMSAPVKLHATRSSVNPAVTLYNALADDLAAEASAPAPAPRRSKRIKVKDSGEAALVNFSADDSKVVTQKSGRSTKRVKVEHITDADAGDEAPPEERSIKSSRSKAPKKQKPIPQSLEKPHPAPEYWREQYDVIRSMRARLKAPVDTMGCDQAQHGETDPKVLLYCEGFPLNILTLARMVDSPRWCPLCSPLKRRTKSRMQPSPNSGLLWEAASPSMVSLLQTSPPSPKRLVGWASGDAKRDT